MASNNNGNSDGKVTAESYGHLQESQTGKEIWMLRIPAKLADAFDRAPEGTVLGELVFRKGGGKKSNIKPALDIHVDPTVATEPQTAAAASAAAASANATSTTLPLQYSLKMTKDVQTLHPFSRHPNGSVKLHGTVTRTGNMQVQQDSNYRALLKDRILATSVHKKTFVKPVDANQVVQQTARNVGPTRKGGFGDAVSELGKRMMEAAERQQVGATNVDTGKKMRFSEDTPLKTIIFQLYEEKPLWTTKGKSL